MTLRIASGCQKVATFAEGAVGQKDPVDACAEVGTHIKMTVLTASNEVLEEVAVPHTQSHAGTFKARCRLSPPAQALPADVTLAVTERTVIPPDLTGPGGPCGPPAARCDTVW